MSTRTLVSCSLVTLLASCAPSTDGGDGSAERRRPRPDAAVIASPDASTTTSTSGTVTCYSQAHPSGTCTLPDVCCFSNYSAQHDGACYASASSCSWGTITCDGPEDCASGQSCCAHATTDPEWGTTGWMLACSASACGAPPLDRELCHPGGAPCAGGKSCVSAYGVANDLPRTLYVCD